MAPVSKNDVIEIEIDGMGYDGEGIAHLGGYTVFIRYALPRERVRATVIFVKPTFAVAKLDKILISSPDRVTPFCPVYGKCGGCSLQHLNYAAQLRFKKDAIKNTFLKTTRFSVEPDEVILSPLNKNYRNKMSLPVRGEKPVAGFFAAGTHRVIPVSDCPVQFEGNGELINAFVSFLHSNGISGYNETTHNGVVRHLVVRKLGGHFTVTVVVNGRFKRELELFNNCLRTLYGNNYAYYINYNTAPNNVILGSESELIGGEQTQVKESGLKVRVHPQSFFQVNDKVRELLYNEIAKEAASDYVIDAYSGAGVLSAIIAKTAKSVTAVEIESKAVESAKDLLSANDIKNVKFICGDCAEELPRIADCLKSEKRDSTVILDPPRGGCDKRALAAAVKTSPKKIIYVSCNPATLARDAAFICEQGYKLDRLTPFDMFPHSPNVETLCVFRQN